MVLVGAIPHTFGINTDPALVQVISSRTIDEIKIQASLMVTLVVVSVPIACLNMLNQFGVLFLLSGADYLVVFTPDQLNALVMLFLDLSNHGVVIAELFWGLWLLPFGLLVIKSGFIPKIIGVFWVLACFGNLMDFFRGVLKIQFPFIIFPRASREPATRFAWGKQACQANGME